MTSETRYAAELNCLIGRNIELTEDGYETSVEGELQRVPDSSMLCVEYDSVHDGDKEWLHFDPSLVSCILAGKHAGSRIVFVG